MNMIVGKVLERKLRATLGEFIEPQDLLSMSITGGSVSLRDLRIRPDVCQRLGLPLSLNAGVIGRLEIALPLAHLFTQPVSVIVNDVLISLSPADTTLLKRARLAAEERGFEDAAAAVDGAWWWCCWCWCCCCC